MEPRGSLGGLADLPVARLTVRPDCRFVDIDVRPVVPEDLDDWRAAIGDVVAFSEAPVEAPLDVLEESVCDFVLDAPVRKGTLLTARLLGPHGEETRVLTKRWQRGNSFTILQARPGAPSEFTVHRNMDVDGVGTLKLHFAHGSQLLKLKVEQGSSIRLREKPCGIEEWEVLEVHTQDLERCPNCRSGPKGGTAFNKDDQCLPGTQYMIVEPKEDAQLRPRLRRARGERGHPAP
ncbi:unnamed protein product, partial [Prorocentrum cordatum]